MLRMQNNENGDDSPYEGGGNTGGGLSESLDTKTKVKRPSFYKVLILNDDFTPMDFVVHILMKFFKYTETEAQKIMLQVHQQGSAIAGVYSMEVAETKVYLVNDYAKKHKHPLKSVLEREA